MNLNLIFWLLIKILLVDIWENPYLQLPCVSSKGCCMNFGVASTLRSTEVSGTCVDKFMNRKFLTKTGNITCQLCIIDVCVPIQNLGSLSSSTSKESQHFDNSATGFPWNQPCHHPAWYLGLAWQYTLDYIKLCHDVI